MLQTVPIDKLSNQRLNLDLEDPPVERALTILWFVRDDTLSFKIGILTAPRLNVECCLLFAELLNRLREGNHTKQDIQTLKQRIISITNHEYPKDAPHVFIQSAKVNDFNARAHNALPGIKYSIKAHDSVIGADSQQLRDKILSQIPNDPRKTKQLHSLLRLAVGERTEISMNARTDDGMTNGAGNVIKLIQVQQTGTPSINKAR